MTEADCLQRCSGSMPPQTDTIARAPSDKEDGRTLPGMGTRATATRQRRAHDTGVMRSSKTRASERMSFAFGEPSCLMVGGFRAQLPDSAENSASADGQTRSRGRAPLAPRRRWQAPNSEKAVAGERQRCVASVLALVPIPTVRRRAKRHTPPLGVRSDADWQTNAASGGEFPALSVDRPRGLSARLAQCIRSPALKRALPRVAAKATPGILA